MGPGEGIVGKGALFFLGIVFRDTLICDGGFVDYGRLDCWQLFGCCYPTILFPCKLGLSCLIRWIPLLQ